MAAHKKPGSLFLPLDVEFMENDRIAEAGERAGWLYLAMSLRSKRLLTDGYLTRRQIERLPVSNTAPRLRALVSAGLISEEPDGRFYITGWSERNSTAAELLARAESKAAGAALGNHRRWHEPEGKFDPRCVHCTNPDASPTSVSTPIAPLIGPAQPSESTKTETEIEAKTEAEAKTEVVTSDRTGDEVAVSEQTAQTLIGEWINHCNARPPKRVVGQVSKDVREMLGEGIAYEHVRRGLQSWSAKGLHPSTLASEVNAAMNMRPGEGLSLVRPDNRRSGDDALREAHEAGLAWLAKKAAQQMELGA